MLSLCIVSNDESGALPKILATTLPWVHEQVIVDTSGGNIVRRLAERFGARRIPRAFTDFGDLRQAAVEEACGDWILVLDPDEEITPEHLRALMAKTLQPDAWGFRIPRYDYIGPIGWGLSRPCRLFCRTRKFRYLGLLHEEPCWLDGLGCEPETAWDVAIHHTGFVRPERHLLQKRALYRTLSERRTPEQDATRGLQNRVMLLADAGDWWHALAAAHEAVWLAPEANAASLSLVVARLWMAVGQPARGLNLLRDAADSLLWDDYRRSRLENVTGLLLLSLERWQEASIAFEAAVRHGYPVAAYLLNWAVARVHCGEMERALEAFTRATTLNPRLGMPRSPSSRYHDRWVHRFDTTCDWEVTKLLLDRTLNFSGG